MKSSEIRDLVDKYAEEIAADRVPKRLYKFRPWISRDPEDQRRNRLILSDQVVWFASPASFNDPFDCRIPYRYDLMSREDFYHRAYQLAKDNNPAWSERQLREETTKVLDDSPWHSTDPVLRARAWKEFADRFAKNYGILSLTAGYQHTLLWSHYADSHRGYCVELDAHLMAASFHQMFEEDRRHVVLFREVRYEESLPVVIPRTDSKKDIDEYMRIFSTKSAVWSYEDERRFIYQGRTNLSRYIHRNAVRRVFLGCQMPQADCDQIANLVSDKLPGAEIWRATRSSEEFKLDFAPL